MVFDIILVPLLQILIICLRMYRFLIFVYIILNLLLTFNALNRNSPMVYSIQSLLIQLIEPVLSPIRRILPPTGVFDFSPIVLILGLQFLFGVISMTISKYFHG